MTDILRELLAGRFRDPETQEVLSVPVKSVVIEKSVAGIEAELVRSLDLPRPYAVISDQNTYEVLGRRVENALDSVIPIRLSGRPHPDEKTAAKVMDEGIGAGSYIAVGSGTINDLAKFAASRQRKRCAVFATAPSMNGYTSVNVAITIDGHKKSLPAVAPEGVFMDLGVLAAAPKRLIRAGFGDAICRTTAQSDWYMAHVLRGSSYRATPFALFADLEDAMVGEPKALLAGDLAAIERLARILVLSGLGMTICGGSHPASQGEHLISHYLEMTHEPGRDEPLHGEQIAVTTLVMARLQEAMIGRTPPVMKASTLGEADIKHRFGEETGTACWKELQSKLLDASEAQPFSELIASKWSGLREAIAKISRSAAEIERALKAMGAPVTARDLDLSRDELCTAVQHAREIRNRYTFLDLAADSGALDARKFVN
jgi:glycerol-1-phosphate dehydrogenase [NAD(P)+]